jgi:hypothetical protein
MQKLYGTFFKTCKLFDKFVQEQKWKIVKNKSEFKTAIENEFCFWTRVIEMLPYEKKILNEYNWLKQCYEQIMNKLENEKINWKILWLENDEQI